MPFPRHGLLSGMVVIAMAVAAALFVGLFLPGWHGPFDVAPTPALLNAFEVSIGVLIVHKVESYRTRKYDVCPVYLTLAHDAPTRTSGQNHFRLLITPLMAGLILLGFAVRGPPWPMLLIGAWLSQAAHELHHLGKTIAARAVYPGLWSALAFVVTVDAFVAPRWFAEVGAPGAWWLYVAAQVPMTAAFVVEHVAWRGRYDAWLAAQA